MGLSPCLQKHLLPNQNNFFSTYFHKKKIPKKRMITETKAKQKRKKTTAKNLSCLFFQNKKNSIGPLISTSPYHLQLCCHTVQCFKYAHVCTPYVVKKNKNFFHPKQFVHQCLGFSHLKRKTTKKNNKKQTDHPPVFTAIVLLIARMCPFKFFLIITNKNNNQFKEKPTKKYIFSVFCLFFKKRENDTTIGNRNKKN